MDRISLSVSKVHLPYGARRFEFPWAALRSAGANRRMTRSQSHTAVKIESFRPEHTAAFEALNRAWLVGHGLLEPADEPGLKDPNGTIIEAGGQVYVAVENGVVIGTCGIAPHGPGEFEVRKLAVASSAQGRGIGRQLVGACIDFARRRGANRISLISNSRLVPALRLYERAGFRHEPLPANNPFATGDVHMVLDVRAEQATIQPDG